MDFGELIDVAEAAMIEPHVHGASMSIDEVLDKIDARIREISGVGFGEGPEAERAAEALESMMPPTMFPPTDE